MKRRILAALLAFCLLFTMAPTTVGATDGATISAGDVTVTAGNYVTVTIRADSFENIASLDLFVYYDSSVMSVSSCSNSTMLSGCTTSTNISTPGVIALSAISLNGINGSGALMTVRFYVNSTCPAGNYPVTVVVGEAYDTSLQPAPIGAVSGKITVNERTVAATTFTTSCSVTKTGLYQGDTVTVTVNGSTSRPFVAANFTFDYDPEIFELQSVSLSNNLAKSDAVYSINDTMAGQVKISYAAVTPASSYALYTVTLKAIADMDGTSKVSATASDVYKENLEAYASHTTSCTFSLYKKAQPVDYPDIFLTTQQLIVGQESGSVLKLQAGAGVAAADFTLTYDPSVLRCVSVTVADRVGQTGGMIVLNDNYSDGTIRFSYINMNGYAASDIELLHITWQPVLSPWEHYTVGISGNKVVDSKFKAVQLEYVTDSGCIYDPIVTPPGCKHDGYTTYYCATCGDSYVSDHLSALGHGFVDGYCIRCGACENPVAEGTCGDSLFWNLTEDGKLIILGAGRMYDYSGSNLTPWYDYRNEIHEVSIGGAVTYIGSMAFYGCQQIAQIEFEGNAPAFHANAFYHVTAAAWYPISNATWSPSMLENYGGTILWMPYGSCGDNLRWELGVDGVLTISGSGEMYDYSLEARSPWNSLISSISKVVICEGVTSVGDYAFYNNGYTSKFVLPDSLRSIGQYAFSDCWSLTSLYLPSGLTELGYGSLNNLWSLSVVVIPEGVGDVSGVFRCIEELSTVIFRGDAPVFSDDTFLYDYTTVYYPAYNDTWTEEVRQNYGGNITWVPYEENYWCDDLSWTFADGILTISGNGTMIDYCYGDIPWYEFRDQITGVVVEEGITRLCKYAFQNCTALTDVSLPNSLQSFGSMLFYNCTALTSIDLPDSITDLGTYAFYSCKSLTDIQLPAGITTIGYGTFYNCTGLTQFEIPASVTEIGSSAFSGCTGLTSIIIPDTVTTLGTYVFSSCTGLTQVQLPTGLTAIGNGMFSYCSGLREIEIPATVTNIGSYAFNGCYGLTKINLPDGVNSLGYGAFQNCTSLTGLVIPAGVTAIPNNAFYGCTSLTAMDIPGNVTSIGNFVFYNCSGLREVTFHPGLQTIGDQSFRGCTQLKQVILPEGLTTIGKFAFKTCSSMEVLELPDTLTSIGDETFHGCSSLKEVVIPRSMTAIGNYMFSQCFGLERIEIPDTVTSIGISAFHTCRSLTNVVIPEGVITLGNYVFSQCTGLQSVVLPSTLTSIGVSVFHTCSSLTSIVIPASVTSIGTTAFYNCYNLKEITICNPEQSLVNLSVPSSAVILCNEGSLAESYAKTYGGGYCAAPEGVTPGHCCSEWTVIREATCSQEGEKTGTCEYCGRTTVASIPKIDHSYTAVVTAPTCTEKGYTTYTCSCGDSYTAEEVDALGHSYTAAVTPPTCTEEGYTTYTCHCGDSYVADEVDALGHSYTATITPPTCTAEGYTTYTCHCGNSYTADAVDALGHSYGEWYETQVPTCEGHGEQQRDCERCDHYETRKTNPNGHNYASVVTAPTCTEQGYTTHTCAHCGDVYVDSYVDALGHSYGDWYVVTDETCTEDGEERHDCTRCDHFETRVVAAIGHNYVGGICGNCGDKLGTITTGNWTMSLDSVIYLNYYPTLTGFAEDFDFASCGGYILWTGEAAPSSRHVMYPGAEYCVDVAGGWYQNDAGEWYIRTPEIFAKNLGDMIYIRPYVIVNGEYVYGACWYYSPAWYCYDILSNLEQEEATRNVCAALLAYGATAQVYFEHNTDELVTDIPAAADRAKKENLVRWATIDLSAYDLAYNEDYIDALPTTSNVDQHIKDLAASLSGTRVSVTHLPDTLDLQGAIRLTVRYSMEKVNIDWSNVASAKVLFWNEDAMADLDALTVENANYIGDLIFDEAEGVYKAQSDHILAKNLDEVVYFSVRIEMNDGTVYRGGLNWYSPEAFVADSIAAESGAIEVCKAIAVYSEMARIRFSQ